MEPRCWLEWNIGVHFSTPLFSASKKFWPSFLSTPFFSISFHYLLGKKRIGVRSNLFWRQKTLRARLDWNKAKNGERPKGIFYLESFDHRSKAVPSWKWARNLNFLEEWFGWLRCGTREWGNGIWKVWWNQMLFYMKYIRPERIESLLATYSGSIRGTSECFYVLYDTRKQWLGVSDCSSRKDKNVHSHAMSGQNSLKLLNHTVQHLALEQFVAISRNT